MRPTTAEYDPVHHSLGDIPAPFRDEAMASHSAPSPKLILNNGGQVSTQPSRDRFAPVHQMAPFPYPMTPKEMKERPWAKRDWLRAELRELKLHGAKWESLSPMNLWNWRMTFRARIREVEGIENNHHDSFREYNFNTCGSAKSWGWKIRYSDGESRLSAFSCGETACPHCYDKDKGRTARRYLNKIMAVAKAQGVRRFWNIVVTLPEAQEASLPKGSDTRRQLLHEIKKFERKLFGLKTEDGLFAYANVHPVGDSNVMRDRFHVHSGVLPIAVRRKNKQASLVKCDIPGKMDVVKARQELTASLLKVFPDLDETLVQFNVSYIPLAGDKGLGRLAHRLNYDLRGFGEDIEEATIFYDPKHGFVVLDGGKHPYGIFTFQQLAERWKWIRSQRDLRSWGLLNQWNKYQELLGVEFAEDPEPEIKDESHVTVIRSFGRKWNKKKRRTEWVDEKKAFDDSGEEIIGVEWGRKGSEGEWRPINSLSACNGQPPNNSPIPPETSKGDSA